MHSTANMTEPENTTERPLKDRLQRVLGTAEELGGAGELRRDRIVEGAEDRGLDRPTAEQAYDIAREERLQPAYALALVLEGVSIRPLESPAPDVETSEPNEPEWVDAPPAPELAERERRLRQTFRRFRSHLADAGSGAPDESAGPGVAGAAVAALADEPDLEGYEY